MGGLDKIEDIRTAKIQVPGYSDCGQRLANSGYQFNQFTLAVWYERSNVDQAVFDHKVIFELFIGI